MDVDGVFYKSAPPYKVPKTYWEMYKDADIPLPEYPEDMDANYSAYDHAIRRWHGLHARGDEIRAPKNLIAMRRGFAALAHYVDDKIGELLEVLEDSGLRDNTVVIVTSDHGEMLGEKGMIQKRGLYEWSARIPLFIDLPNAAPCRIDTPVSLLDVPATLIELAGQVPVRPLRAARFFRQSKETSWRWYQSSRNITAKASCARPSWCAWAIGNTSTATAPTRNSSTSLKTRMSGTTAQANPIAAR
ncbi:sulfatase-like hydrolase/transferase [Sulfitobacter sediminilitoris]|uniref:sulfatase-like hydrolase/transferase n=1 Tax=Sulfitobacter sediminilitoris TaxID=2698830 RepID=UPI003616863A